MTAQEIIELEVYRGAAAGQTPRETAQAIITKLAECGFIVAKLHEHKKAKEKSDELSWG